MIWSLLPLAYFLLGFTQVLQRLWKLDPAPPLAHAWKNLHQTWSLIAKHQQCFSLKMLRRNGDLGLPLWLPLLKSIFSWSFEWSFEVICRGRRPYVLLCRIDLRQIYFSTFSAEFQRSSVSISNLRLSQLSTLDSQWSSCTCDSTALLYCHSWLAPSLCRISWHRFGSSHLIHARLRFAPWSLHKTASTPS